MGVWWRSQGSQTTKRSCTKPTGSQLSSLSSKNQPSSLLGQSQPATASSSYLYLSQFPGFLHPYIDDIVDEGDDEDCGFRAIVTLLGWDEESWACGRYEVRKSS